jgi:hypothetical protein
VSISMLCFFTEASRGSSYLFVVDSFVGRTYFRRRHRDIAAAASELAPSLQQIRDLVGWLRIMIRLVGC